MWNYFSQLKLQPRQDIKLYAPAVSGLIMQIMQRQLF